jgi:hypothetical protein
MATVLVLFVESDEKSHKLMDLLQARPLGTGANLKSIKEIVCEGSTLKKELDQSRCVVLVSTKQSSELITEQGKAEEEDGFVLFDGKLIQKYLQNNNFLKKLIVIQFGKAVSTANVPDGYDSKKVFVLDDNFTSKDAVLDLIEDAVKGMLTSKVKESEKEKKNGGSGCTLA